MKMNKTAIAAAVAASMGSAVSMIDTASAALLADGNYQIVINNTPYTTGYQFGSDGAWNSGFTFGCQPGSKGCASQSMYDNNVAVNGKGGAATDGVAGRINISVVNGVISGGNLFQVDTIKNTAGGNFAQYTANGTASGMTGTIDNTGNMTFTPTNRLGTVGSFPSLVDERWNVDNFNGGTTVGTVFTPNAPNGNTAWNVFTTGAATNSAGTTNGTVISACTGGYCGTVVSSGQVGADWGGFFGAAVNERWNIKIVFTGPLQAPIPVPAAVWLFGSGLLGLAGIARRKKKA